MQSRERGQDIGRALAHRQVARQHVRMPHHRREQAREQPVDVLGPAQRDGAVQRRDEQLALADHRVVAEIEHPFGSIRGGRRLEPAGAGALVEDGRGAAQRRTGERAGRLVGAPREHRHVLLLHPRRQAGAQCCDGERNAADRDRLLVQAERVQRDQRRRCGQPLARQADQPRDRLRVQRVQPERIDRLSCRVACQQQVAKASQGRHGECCERVQRVRRQPAEVVADQCLRLVEEPGGLTPAAVPQLQQQHRAEAAIQPHRPPAMRQAIHRLAVPTDRAPDLIVTLRLVVPVAEADRRQPPIHRGTWDAGPT